MYKRIITSPIGQSINRRELPSQLINREHLNRALFERNKARNIESLHQQMVKIFLKRYPDFLVRKHAKHAKTE